MKFEIEGLVDEILDQLPAEVWTSTTTTFFDPAIGGGQFVNEIENRLRIFGHSDDNIKGRVSGCESSKLNVKYAVNKNKLVGNYEVCDFLEKDFGNMKFDVIVGNPPYQRENNDAKRWTLWSEFVKKSFQLADTVTFVVPQSLSGPGEMFNLVRDKCSVLNINVSKYFNVGSTFCYFVAHPNQYVTSTKIITEDAEYIKDISKLPFLPLSINNETLLQLNQLISRPKRPWVRGELHTSNKHLFSEFGKYAVMHTNAQELKTDTEHENKSKIRVAVSLSGYPIFKVIQDQYASQACFWTEFDNLEDATKFAQECNDVAIQDMLKIFKWSGWNSKEVIQCL
jgi:hypothetical protein